MSVLMAIWLAVGIGGLGFGAGYVLGKMHERRDEEMMRRRLAMEDRPARRPRAVGTARVEVADYRQRRPEAGMEM